ncbi:MAG: PQQ-binding-like beta-propeller repeat protein [Bacteroidota bacterium]
MKYSSYKILFYAFILFISSQCIYAQDLKFAWISDLHIGYKNADADLQSIVENINGQQQLSFVIATGDIAEQGFNDQLMQAKKILDQLKIKYYVVPGNHDTYWSHNAGNKFRELWGSDRFTVTEGNTTIIGISSAIVLKGHSGHISPEMLKYLDDILSKTPKTRQVIVVLHHPLDGETDNWFQVTNRLKDYNARFILNGHGHYNRLSKYNGIPAAMIRTILAKKPAAVENKPGYSIVSVWPDSLSFTEVRTDSTYKYWGSLSVSPTEETPHIDSLQFISYNAEILSKTELNETLAAAPLAAGNRIFAATLNGNVYCFDANGTKLWKTSTGGTITSRPALSGNTLVIATVEGDIICLNASSGQMGETIGLGEPVTSQLIITDYTGTKYLMNGSRPEKCIIAGTASGAMFCYDLKSLEQIWENHDASGMIETRPLCTANKLIYGSWDGHLYCLDVRTGLLTWKWSENPNFYYSPAACTPVSDGKLVFITAPDKFVSAIDINLGKTAWRKNDYQSWESIGLSEDAKRLFVKSFSDKFYIVNAANGKKISEINLKYGVNIMPTVPVEKAGQILVGLENGTLYSVDKTNKAEALLFAGTARLHSVQVMDEGLFAVSNMDGKIVIFKNK